MVWFHRYKFIYVMFELIQVKFWFPTYQFRFIQPLHRPAIEWISPRWWPFLLLKVNLGPSTWQCQRQLYTDGNYSVPNNQHVESCPVATWNRTLSRKYSPWSTTWKKTRQCVKCSSKTTKKRKYPVLLSFMLRILSIKFVVRKKLENNLTTENI